ncbi:DUF3857 domain-containing protein [Tunturibacter empetritectus]|uniref:Tetratricopeptide (TPR) repeat protein n=1 Tax=Tunturiibacter lichenicola TaxID=2051959 RepID=A0A7W8J403_9BACT|nr:DUF3857 domain-containing protein [Edaphobacter lichenicola]MBB5342100.1 tetratricopeptide (TPR) repeat protein [Edaphobacter lichenicola]
MSAPASGVKGAVSPPDYSGEPGIIQHMDRVYQVEADGTGWRLLTTSVQVLTEGAVKQFGVLSVAFASSSESVEIIYARVKRPDGTVVETPVSGAMEQADSVTQAAPFYSDLKQKQLPIRSLSVGDTLEWQAKVVRTKAEAPGHFWGQETFFEDAVILSQSVELRVPKDAFVNVWSPTLKPTETTAAGYRVLRWENSQLKPTVGKEADAAKEAKSKVVWTPEQELEATQGKLPMIAWTNFKSWEDVGAWYRGLEKDRTAPDEEIKAKVAELTAGKTTEEEKVRAVYGYVATQIRYIGVAFGVGRYQPHRAEEVMQNRYGDCKDKHTLLASMLEVLGLHPDAVLIGAGIRFNDAVPSPAAFNHLITMVAVDGKDVWLDATAEVAPYKMLSYSIRDKQALVIPGAAVAQVERTPAKLPFASYQAMHAEGSLDKEGTSNSRLTMTFRGDDELVMRSVLRQLSPAQYDQVVQQMSQNIGYQGTTSHAEVSKPDDTAEPLKISYDYKREKGGDWDNYRILPQIAPVSLTRPDEKTPPVRAILLGVPRTETSTAEMKLPAGWGVELPEAVHQKSPYATYDETYRFEKGTLYTERRIEVLQDKVPVSDWKSYKKWADAVDLGNEQYVQLTGMAGKTSDASVGSPSTMENNTEAQTLVEDAFSDVQQGHLDAAQLKLDTAKSLNARQMGLWRTYGYLAFSRGQSSNAIEDLQQEVKNHPEQQAMYGPLAEAQIRLGRVAEAKETLKSWASVDKSNSMPSVRLVQVLLEQKNAKEAVSEAESAIAKLPADKKNDGALQLELGRAELRAGMKDKGRVTLLALMRSTEDPLMMNNSAYELADAGLELEAADAATRTALDKMAEESRAWTLDESPQMLAAKSRLIAATWDTMGWILYREGKTEEAESYLRASWRNDQSAEEGKHLALLLEKKGDRDAALTMYELAAATISDYDATGAKKAPGEQKLELQKDAEALRKMGATSSTHDAHKTLQELRTIPLGAAKGLSGRAEYRLLMNDGKVTQSKAVRSYGLKDGEERVKAMRVTGFTPAGSQANLVRTGMMDCHGNVCEVVLEP